MVLELTSLYDSVLKQTNNILAPGKRVVIIIPRFRTREDRTFFIGIDDMARSNSFMLVYKPIIYAYKESKIIREICVLEKI